MAAVGWVCVVCGLIAASILWRAWVFCCGWSWVIVPAFGVPDVGLAVSVGVMALVSLCTHQVQHRGEDSRPFGEQLGAFIGEWFAIPLAALFIFWVVSFWVEVPA